MACSYKYKNQRYEIVTSEYSNQCLIFKSGSSLPPSKGAVLNAQQLHVPLSGDIFDTLGFTKNVYKVDIRKTLKLEQWCEILGFDAEIVSIPFVCKKHFSKKCFTEYINPITSTFIKYMRLVSTPDNKNETLEITVDVFKLPKKIKGHKVIKLGEEIIVSTKAIIGDVSKFEPTSDSLPQPVNTTTRITKRKFEVPYPIKLAAGFVAFFGVLEVGSALISKVVNKIK